MYWKTLLQKWPQHLTSSISLSEMLKLIIWCPGSRLICRRVFNRQNTFNSSSTISFISLSHGLHVFQDTVRYSTNVNVNGLIIVIFSIIRSRLSSTGSEGIQAHAGLAQGAAFLSSQRRRGGEGRGPDRSTGLGCVSSKSGEPVRCRLWWRPLISFGPRLGSTLLDTGIAPPFTSWRHPSATPPAELLTDDQSSRNGEFTYGLQTVYKGVTANKPPKEHNREQ